MTDHKRLRTVITYGTFDLLHHGHIRLLERAKALGDYLIVGVTSDAFDRERGKLNVSQSLLERARAVEALDVVDQVIVEEYQGQKIADIQRYGVDIFAIGSDWRGKFDYLNPYCEVVYLDRTQGVSSTELRKQRAGNDIGLAIWGDNYLSYRLIDELNHVNGLVASSISACPGDIVSPDHADAHPRHEDIERIDSYADSLSQAGAVYISASFNQRAQLVRMALQAGKHVLFEAPLSSNVDELNELFALADSQGLVCMPAVKTRFFPAFHRLTLLLASGVIGEIKDIDASFSHVFDTLNTHDVYQGALYDMSAYIALPVTDLFCDEPSISQINVVEHEGFCLWAKIDVQSPTATATLRVGRGIKTEGDMTITGTQGYIYVPSPWWLTDYFEIRGEDLRSSRRIYARFMGTGQRYELFEFVRRIKAEQLGTIPAQELRASQFVASLLARYEQGTTRELGHLSYCFGGGETCTDR